jgi:hypothetical protein
MPQKEIVADQHLRLVAELLDRLKYAVAERKSGMPLSVDVPAPPKNTVRFDFSKMARS